MKYSEKVMQNVTKEKVNVVKYLMVINAINDIETQ